MAKGLTLRLNTGGSRGPITRALLAANAAWLLVLVFQGSVLTQGSEPSAPLLAGGNVQISTGFDDQISTSQPLTYDPVSNRWLAGYFLFRSSEGLVGQPVVRAVEPDGQLPFAPVNLDPSAFMAAGPSLIGSAAGFLATWNTPRAGPTHPQDLVARSLNSAGSPQAAPTDVTPALDGVNQGHPASALNPDTARLLTVWAEESPRDGRPYRDRIMGAVLEPNGTVFLGPFVVAEPPLSGAPNTFSGHINSRPSVAFDAVANVFLVVWRRVTFSNGVQTSVVVQGLQLDGAGALLGSPFSISLPYSPTAGHENALNYSAPRAAARDGYLGGFFVTWDDARDAAATGLDVYLRQVNSLTFVLIEPEVPLVVAVGDQIHPTVAFLGGASLITWVDARPGGHVHAAMYGPETYLLTPPVQVSSVPSLGFEGLMNPSSAANTTTGEFLVAWSDQRFGGRYQVFAQRVAPPADDPDVDSIPNGLDNCPSMHNLDQENIDQDALGNACDSDPTDGPMADADADGIPNGADPNPADGPSGDVDLDGALNENDLCPLDPDPAQLDSDEDGAGDACDVTVTLLHSFDVGSDGNELTQGPDRHLYGTTYSGGANDVGTVFRMDLTGGITYLHSFGATPADGRTPAGPLVIRPDGSIYGTTAGGGQDQRGTVFRIDSGGTYAVLHAFSGPDGSNPGAGLTLAADGNLYGMTAEGGAWGAGVMFRVTPAGSFSVLHEFDGITAGNPSGRLVQAPNGYFYGTSATGGVLQVGTIFQISALGDLAIVHTFNEASGGSPIGSLEMTSEGVFVGTTSSGGVFGSGIMYRFTLGGDYRVTYDFSNSGGTPLTKAAGGFVYGLAADADDILRVTPGGYVRPFHAFSDEVLFQNGGGIQHRHRLFRAADGFLYGTTGVGGTHNRGVVYRVETPNTPAGTNVDVTPGDTTTSSRPVTLTFAQVTAPGMTSLTISASGPAPPAGFSLGEPPVFYDLTTSAAVAAPITVCLDYSGTTFSDESTVRLFHYENGAWADRTVSLDTETNRVCAATASLSPFAVFASTADVTPPTVACGTADGGWHAADVSIPCGAQDVGSGLADPADANFTLTTSVPAGIETATAATNSRLVCDLAGNCATAGPIGGNRVDKRPATITIMAPSQGPFVVDQPVVASYGCSDGGAGVATCEGTVANGATMPTSAAGSYAFVVTARDQAGNVSIGAVTYTVSEPYVLMGLFAPYAPPAEKQFKAGSSIPLKWQYAQGGVVADTGAHPPTLAAFGPVACTENAAVATVAMDAPGDSGLHYDAATRTWQFNWKTAKGTDGCFNVVITQQALGVSRTFPVKVAK